MFSDEFVFFVLKLNSFLFERVVHLLMFLSEGNQFLFTLLDVLVIEVETQWLTFFLEFDLVTEKHYLKVRFMIWKG